MIRFYPEPVIQGKYFYDTGFCILWLLRCDAPFIFLFSWHQISDKSDFSNFKSLRL